VQQSPFSVISKLRYSWLETKKTLQQGLAAFLHIQPLRQGSAGAQWILTCFRIVCWSVQLL